MSTREPHPTELAYAAAILDALSSAPARRPGMAEEHRSIALIANLLRSRAGLRLARDEGRDVDTRAMAADFLIAARILDISACAAPAASTLLRGVAAWLREWNRVLEPIKACPKCGRAALGPGVLIFSCRNGLCGAELDVRECPELGKPHQWGDDDRCAYCGKTQSDHDAELAALIGRGK